MANVRISQAADAGTLLSSDMLPLARSGDTNAYHATMAEVATFANASVASGAYGNVGRNKLHNGLFNVQQRGNPGWSAAGYTVDRWRMDLSLDAMAVGVTPFAVTGTAGDEEAANALEINVTGNAGAGAFSLLRQMIENVKRLSGKTVTISFVAYLSSGTAVKLGVSLRQNFGSGGTPSANTDTASSVTITTTPTRYSVTLAVPSVSGKTLGTNNDHSTECRFWFSCGAANSAIAGNPGVQTGVFVLWGVQLEVGSVATPLEKLDPRLDLANCQRFYQTGNIRVLGWSGGSGLVMAQMQPYVVSMRAVPTVTPAFTTQTNCTGSVTSVDINGFEPTATSAATVGQIVLSGTYTASADL